MKDEHGANSIYTMIIYARLFYFSIALLSFIKYIVKQICEILLTCSKKLVKLA